MNAHTVFNEVPCSFDEVQSREDRSLWEEAIKVELSAHKLNNTWTIVKKPENKKWVFTLRHDEMGNPVRYKARLVKRGFKQKKSNRLR